jgi:hypothetical protein
MSGPEKKLSRMCVLAYLQLPKADIPDAPVGQATETSLARIRFSMRVALYALVGVDGLTPFSRGVASNQSARSPVSARRSIRNYDDPDSSIAPAQVIAS